MRNNSSFSTTLLHLPLLVSPLFSPPPLSLCVSLCVSLCLSVCLCLCLSLFPSTKQPFKSLLGLIKAEYILSSDCGQKQQQQQLSTPKYKKEYSYDGLPGYTVSSLKAVRHRYILFVFMVCSFFSAHIPSFIYLRLYNPFILNESLCMSSGLSWMSDINYIRWSFQALSIVEIKDLRFDCNASLVPAACPSTGSEALAQYGLDKGGLGVAAAGLGGSVVFFLTITLIAIRFIPQKPQDE